MPVKKSAAFSLVITMLIVLPACGSESAPSSSPVPTSVCCSNTPASSRIPSEESTPALSDATETLPDYPEKPMEALRVSGIMSTPEESEPLGPYAFCVKNEDIYVPNYFTNTIGIYRDGQLVDEWQNTVGKGIAVMAFVGDTLYTISASNIEEECGILCRWDGGKIVDSSVATDRYEDGVLNQVNLILDRSGQVLLEYATGDNFLVSDTGEMKKLCEYSFDWLENGFIVTSNDTGAAFKVSGKYEPSCVSPIGHKDGIVYFEYVDGYVMEDCSHRFNRNVFQFADDGTLINIFPMKEYWDYVPNTEICIDRHHVYQLYTENDQVSVIDLSPAESEMIQ